MKVRANLAREPSLMHLPVIVGHNVSSFLVPHNFVLILLKLKAQNLINERLYIFEISLVFLTKIFYNNSKCTAAQDSFLDDLRVSREKKSFWRRTHSHSSCCRGFSHRCFNRKNQQGKQVRRESKRRKQQP